MIRKQTWLKSLFFFLILSSIQHLQHPNNETQLQNSATKFDMEAFQGTYQRALLETTWPSRWHQLFVFGTIWYLAWLRLLHAGLRLRNELEIWLEFARGLFQGHVDVESYHHVDRDNSKDSAPQSHRLRRQFRRTCVQHSNDDEHICLWMKDGSAKQLFNKFF